MNIISKEKLIKTIMPELTSLQKKVLKLFSDSDLKERFYWTGGTALSTLYLQHRRSEDLDFFSDEPFSHDQVLRFVRKLKRQLNLDEVEEQKIFDRWEFFLHNEDELRLEFVFYDHENIKARNKWKGIEVDSLEDIAVNKVMTLFERNDPKDVVDLYYLLTEEGYEVKELLDKTKEKFGVKFNEDSFWSESCRIIEDLDGVTPLLEKNKTERKEIINAIKDYFLSKSSDYLDKKLE